MIEAISTKLLDILQADSRLIDGGNAYAAGWPAGVTREENGDTPAVGRVNLFDKPWDKDSGDHRPAVYVGSRAMEATDSLDFPAVSSGGRREFRILLIPLVVAVQAPTKAAARRQRNQLRHNIKVILLDNLLANGYWYELTTPGQAGGGAAREAVWTTATGGSGTQVAEGMAVIPCQVRYSWSATCDA